MTDVLVTGGAGFVGSRICAKLLRQGYHVDVLDDLSVGKRDNVVPGVEGVLVLPVEDVTTEILATYDAVVHCAAHADLRRNWDARSERDSLLYRNVLSTIALLERLALSTRALVFLSTAAVYGSSPDGSADEGYASAETVESPYAASKLSAEAYVAAYCHHDSRRWYAIRPVAIVGSGYAHGHIADFVQMARGGCVRALDDGSQRKPYVHVEDVADVVAALLPGRLPDGAYNVSSPDLWSIRDTLRLMGLPSREIAVEYGTSRSGWVGDPVDLRVSTERLASYGIRCRRPVEVGVRDALRGLGWEARR